MIPIVREDEDMGPVMERCCFCRTPTRMWTDLPDRKPGEQVACCTKCSETGSPKAVPTKAIWYNAERGKAWAIP